MHGYKDRQTDMLQSAWPKKKRKYRVAVYLAVCLYVCNTTFEVGLAVVRVVENESKDTSRYNIKYAHLYKTVSSKTKTFNY